MDYIKSVFQRANLQQLREFLLYGQEGCKLDQRPYLEQLREADDAVDDTLEQYIPDPKALDRAADKISHAFSVYEAVYTEIGLQTGAALVFELLRPFLRLKGE